MSVVAEFLAPVGPYPVGSVLTDRPDTTVGVDSVVPSGGVAHSVWIRGAQQAAVVDDLRSLDAVDAVTVVDTRPDRTLVMVSWSDVDSSVFALADAAGGRVVDATGAAEGWTIRIRFPSETALREFYEASQERDLALEVRQLHDADPSAPDDALSEKQRETLEAAFDAGYFGVPRQVTLDTLAAELDISEQGVSERLRRGLASFLERALPAEPGTETDDPVADGDRT